MNPVSVKGCCIRFPETGPVMQEDATHASVGIASVAIDAAGGGLRVTHTESAPVVTIMPVLDETLSQRGLTVGGSGGAAYSICVFYHPDHGQLDLRNPAHYALLMGSTTNLWYTVVQYTP